ncbi:MAG: HK97 family phage prohead protease [Terriglobales bacterium]
MENRQYRMLDHAELRATGDQSITGYAAVFNVPSLPLGSGKFTEKIRAGAFASSLNEDVVGLYDHNPANVLGRTAAGTLELREDSIGLEAKINLPPTQLGRDVYTLVKRGDLRGMSFGFNVTRDKWNAAHTERELLEVDLHEVSVVTFPAYKQTSISARSLGLPADAEFLSYPGVPPQLVSEAEKHRLVMRVQLLRRLGKGQ